MLLSNFPTAAIPSVSGTLDPYQRYEEESRRCAGFCFSFKNSWLALIVEVVKKKIVTPLRQSHAKVPSMLAALLAKGR
ncbi:hypothetical protein ACIQU2_24990 [Pseudomonas sp. NPDC098740]|uniref:hypothetical protein n=1 Tax=Pseudomonas sp. NPDC098740 TaxID=3364486 RepID=UPI00383AA519